jgi:hypothetical protein
MRRVSGSVRSLWRWWHVAESVPGPVLMALAGGRVSEQLLRELVRRRSR